MSQKITIEELQDKLVKLNEEAKSIQAQADADKRELSEEESRQVEAIFATFEATETEIARRQKLEEQNEKLARVQPRLVTPEAVEAAEAPKARPVSVSAPRQERSVVTGGDYNGASKGTWGWRSLGEYATGVRNAGRGKIDPRLVANAPTTYGSEGTNADGGYAVPPDFRADIVVKVMGEDSLLGRTDQQTTSSNQITVPVDETTPWAASGGLQVAWESEAAVHAQSKPALTQVTVRAYKLAALVPVTDELLEDTASLGNYLRRKVPEKFNFKINDAIINGTGTGQPLGLMNSGAKVAQAKEGSQAAATVVAANITKMWSRLYAPLRNRAVWLINQDVEPQLLGLTLGGSSVAFPIYLPPGGFSASPYATLLGRPIIPVESCATLGTEGDIILCDLSQYLSVVKAGGMRQDVSIHLWFDYDVTAFKFTMRVGGQNWWNTAITRKNGSNTLTNIVTLAVRS